jgi:hypothetical protein
VHILSSLAARLLALLLCDRIWCTVVPALRHERDLIFRIFWRPPGVVLDAPRFQQAHEMSTLILKQLILLLFGSFKCAPHRRVEQDFKSPQIRSERADIRLRLM